MANSESGGPAERPKRVKKRAASPSLVNLSPSALLQSSMRERIEALGADKSRLEARLDQLQARVDQLGPENARLGEALANAESNNTAATALIGVGGFLVSYATFTGHAAERWANVAAGCLLAGIGLMLWQTALRRRR